MPSYFILKVQLPAVFCMAEKGARLACAALAILTSILYGTLVYAEKKDNSRVKDLAYGSVLYHYFQQDYFSALSELLIADEQQTIEQDKQKSELLRGGIYLSYGMDAEAETLFTQVLEQGDINSLGSDKRTSRENLSRAWFYLGKLRYKKGDYDLARESFARVNKSLTGGLKPEFAFLSDSTRLRLQDKNQQANLQQAVVADYSPKVSQQSSWSYYRDYNDLLKLLSAVPDSEASNNTRKRIADDMMAIAERIGSSEETQNVEELLALRDQIYTSAGFLNLQTGKSSAAIKSFKRVRENSVLVGQALLGYGWAAANEEDYKRALAPWQQLAQHSMLDPTTHEALLAVPFAYEKLGADSAALQGYDESVLALQNELKLLNQIDGELSSITPEQLSGYYLSDSVHWLDEKLPDAESDSSGFARDVLDNRLLELLAQNQFSYLEKQRQDIQWLLASLQRWELDLEAIRFVVEERQSRRDTAVSDKALQDMVQRESQLVERLHELNETMKIALDNRSASFEKELMKADEEKVWQRIESAEQSLQRLNNASESVLQQLPNNKERQAQQKKVALAKGLLTWQIHQDASDRQWQLVRLQKHIADGLAQSEEKRRELLALANSTSIAEQEFASAEQLQHRVSQQREDAQLLANKIDGRILAMLRDDVDRLRKRTTVYLAQSSMARARLLDTLSESGDMLADASATEANDGIDQFGVVQ